MSSLSMAVRIPQGEKEKKVTNQHVANPMINNAGAVACVEDTGDLDQCLADRLVQNKHDADDRNKKRHKAQDEGMAFMQSQSQPLPSPQPLQAALSLVMTRLTVADGFAAQPDTDGTVVQAETESAAQAVSDKTMVKTASIPPAINVAVKRANQAYGHPLLSTASPVAAVHSPVASSTENTVGIAPVHKRGDEPAEKIAEAALAIPRAVGAQPTLPSGSAASLKPADIASPTGLRCEVLPAVATDDVASGVAGKTIDLDILADQVVVRYAVNDQTSARLQVAQQTIIPASSDVRLNNMLIGQQSLTTFDPSWILQGSRQARPYYLASVSSQDRVNQTSDTWDERDQ